MGLQSSGEITFADIILEHRPNNTTVGSGLKPFKLNDYNAYSTSTSLPLTFSEFYSTSSSYNTTRYDVAYTSSGSGENFSENWAASLFDVREYKVSSGDYTPNTGSQCSLTITFTNGGTYKCRFYFNSTGASASGSIGYGSTFTTATIISNTNGFFGRFTNSTLNITATSSSTDLANMYVRIIRVA